jgi:putative spermidine/putrescine transport system ATP-binding protein
MAESGDSRGGSVAFQDIGRVFGSVAAVRDFSMTVAAGEFLTLLGPSGSGKTTVLNMVAGFLDPTSGDILIGGRSIASLPTEKRNVGMVFQSYSLFPHMTVLENVAFPLKMRHATRELIRERVAYALELVHLGDLGQRMPHQLSGGQRQRVAFARAIVFEPQVLLMDEPLGALDLKLREHMQIEIKHYQQQIGCTVIYVTHDQGEALTLSDRIVIMNEGRIVQIGSPEEIYDFPKTRFAAEFIGETNIFKVRPAEAGNGHWLIEEAQVTFPLPETGAHRDDTIAHLSLRPEKIVRLNGEADSRYVELDAVVAELVFLGDVVRYTAKLPGGTPISFKEHRTGSTGMVKVGERVRLGFLPGDAVLLAESGKP